jgi:hypothetical protein
MYNLHDVPTTLVVQSWIEIISGGTRTKKVEYHWSSQYARITSRLRHWRYSVTDFISSSGVKVDTLAVLKGFLAQIVELTQTVVSQHPGLPAVHHDRNPPVISSVGVVPTVAPGPFAPAQFDPHCSTRSQLPPFPLCWAA